jgi:hypothetical protein
LDYYAQTLNERRGRLHVVPYGAAGFPGDIFDWLQGCAALLTGASTVAVEAMLMDVPVVTMDYASEIESADFIQFGATVHVRSGEALIAAVRNILARGAPGETRLRAEAFLRQAFHALDGRSAERGAEALCVLTAEEVKAT